MEYKFKKDIYTKRSIIRAAYNFTDNYYVHIDADDSYYIINLSSKSESNTSITPEDFQNEVLSYLIRENIQEKTKNIRELILARAFASTIIEEETSADNCSKDESCITNIDDILKDWFDKNE